jgi:Ca2+-dependent lipid-binding protein
VADFAMIDGAVRRVILNVINSMLVLPNRLLIKLDAGNDYFKTYLYPLGILRITVEKAWGFAEEKKGAGQKFLSKLTRASPDAYCNVSVGAEDGWRTSTKNNTTSPAWNEVHDFIIADFDQCITFDLLDQDVGVDDQIGLAVTTVKDALLAGGKQELSLMRKEEPTEGKISLSCEFYRLAADGGSFSASDHRAEGRLCGVATVLVAGAFGIPGQREELQPSVVVTWGEKHHFQTATKSDAPGTDISNPTFEQAFRIPVTADMVGSGAQSFRIALMNKKHEMGAVDVPLSDVLKAPDMILQNKLDVGGGATVRASICLRGISPAATMEEAKLTQRQK